MKSEMEKLQKKYAEQTEFNQSNIYAQMGSLGISPTQLKSYEDSLGKIEAFKEQQSTDGRNTQ